MCVFYKTTRREKSCLLGTNQNIILGSVFALQRQFTGAMAARAVGCIQVASFQLQRVKLTPLPGLSFAHLSPLKHLQHMLT